MNRRYAVIQPQQPLSAVAACAFGMTREVSDEQSSKPAHREAPPSA